MANIIVVSFKEETKAIEALHKIKELDSYGDITLYDHMMIRKKENGKYETLKDDTSTEGWRTLTGTAVGGLLGALAGPVGFVIGLFSGLTVGAVADINRYDFEKDFVKKVSNQMKVGTTAIVAEVDEDSSVFIDNYLKPFEVDIIRTDAGWEFDNFVNEKIEEIEDKIEEQREKLKKATTGEKEKIKTKIAELKAKRKIKIAELEAKSKTVVEEIKNKTKTSIDQLESRLQKYEDSITDAISNARKNRIKKRIKKLEDKLSQLQVTLGEDIVG